MRIQSKSRIPHPFDRVYTTYRDEISFLADYLPDIKEIRVENRTTHDDGIEQHNRWIPAVEVPRLLAGLIKKEMMEWDDFAQWNDEGGYVAWELRFPAFPNRVKCTGRNSFSPDGDDATVVVLDGNLDIDFANFPGVPNIMAKRLGPRIEQFVINLITPNLERVNTSLGRYLDDKA